MGSHSATFERGPIRPPSEAGSLLLRFTRNCPWNKCAFCPVYKGREFSRRSLDEIRGDIDAVHEIIEDLQGLSRSMGLDGAILRPVLNAVLSDSRYGACCREVAAWLFFKRGTVFIQDANSLLLPTDVLAEALRYLKSRVPGIERITSYARSGTLARKSPGELSELREAGLDRIHVGMESGSDRVLRFVRKGVTARQHIEGGRKVVESGMSLSEYIMPGLGGKEWSREHALETARVLNAIDPHFIRLRSLRLPPTAPLHEEMKSGAFVPLSDDDAVREIRLLVESLHGIGSTITSDHIMNLLPEVEGVLPDDKQKMLDVIDRYLALPDEERLLFRLGRRGGALNSSDDLQSPETRARLERARRDLEAETGMDIEHFITELGDQYI
jgi:hypothetical protein